MPNRLYETAQYILNNPGKVLTLSLAGQVLGSSALNFQDPPSVRGANLTQGFRLTKPLLNNSLALIEQRALLAFNLTWLNQSDSKQMESIPEAWLNTNDTFLDKNLHRTKRADPHDLELAKQDAIEDCVMAIRNGDLMQVKESWESIYPLYLDGVTFKRIIKGAYAGSVCNYEKVDYFIQNSFNSISLKLAAYQILMSEMRINNQLFTSETLRLAYTFNQIMNYPGYLLLKPESKSRYELEKSNFPQAIKYLLYNKVCLRSVAQNNEYLYASWFNMPNNTGKQVFTWIPNEYAGVQAVWRFESSDEGKTFYIYNPKQEAYLHAIHEKYDNDRRNVVVQSVKGVSGKWRVQLAATESEIILWNDYHGETLYSAFKYNDNRRYVFTWLKGSILTARWKVEDCGSYSRKRRDTSDDGLENMDLTLNTKQVFFQIKEQANQINKTSGLNREAIEESMSRRFNKTILLK